MNDDDQYHSSLFPLTSDHVKQKVSAKKFKDRNPIWTDCKARLIERYLYYFVLITKTGTYIDGFAGPQESGKHEMWSAKLVIESLPRWLKTFFLFDIEPSQVDFLQKMWEGQLPRDKTKREPKRKVQIYQGDFNQMIVKMLNDFPIRDKEPAFCLLDQRMFECDWATIETLAKHKRGGNKIELFYFFPEGWINRSIAAIKFEKDAKLQRWWGKANWDELMGVSGAHRAQLVCARFRDELGYKHVYPFPIYERKDEGGRIMYHMIHASDHDEAPGLMSRAYEKALDLKETSEQFDFEMGWQKRRPKRPMLAKNANGKRQLLKSN